MVKSYLQHVQSMRDQTVTHKNLKIDYDGKNDEFRAQMFALLLDRDPSDCDRTTCALRFLTSAVTHTLGVR